MSDRSQAGYVAALKNRRFLAADTFPGVAGLIYEVTWTRLLTLRLGPTIAAASTVVAAFMGGLALGLAQARSQRLQ